MINQKMILKKRLNAFIDKAIFIHKDIINDEARLNRIRENVEQVFDEIITEGFDRILKKSDIDEEESLKRRKKIEKYSNKIMERRLRKYKKTLT